MDGYMDWNISLENSELRQEIEILQKRLLSANEEIGKLVMENSKLTRELNELKEKIGIHDEEEEEEEAPPSPVPFINSSGSIQGAISKVIEMCEEKPKKQKPLQSARYQKKGYEISFDANSSFSSDPDHPLISMFARFAAIATANPRINYTNTWFVSSATPQKVMKPSIPLKRGSGAKNIIILADQQGKNIRKHLEGLLNDNYKVVSYFKPGAKLADILDVNKVVLEGLTFDDYIILIGGINDNNEIDMQYHLCKWLSATQNTNIMLVEIPNNKHMNVDRVNVLLKYLVDTLPNLTFVKRDYVNNYYSIHKHKMTINLAKNLANKLLETGKNEPEKSNN